jgi:hypothetical protein
MRRSIRSLGARRRGIRLVAGSLTLVAGIAVAIPASATGPTQITGFAVAFQGTNGDVEAYVDGKILDLGAAIAPGTKPSFSVNPTTHFKEIAWQGANQDLWVDTGSGASDTGLQMWKGSSPSLSVMGPNGPIIAFRNANGSLWEIQTGVGNWALPGTIGSGSPSLAVNPVTGASEIAWQGPNNDLWVQGVTGPHDTGVGMKAGSSPALAMVPGSGNVYEAAVHGGNDDLWVYSPFGTSDLHDPMATATSPTIDPNSGSLTIGWAGANGDAWILSPNGPQDLKVQLAPYTSPSVAEAPGDTHGGMALQVGASGLEVTGDTGTTAGINVAPGTNPAAAYYPF